jgi:hypothetical protein
MIVKISDKQAEYILKIMNFYCSEMDQSFTKDEHVLIDEIRGKFKKSGKRTRAKNFNFRISQ